jgi:glycerophosphoryl diester phosphodiesterase
MSLPRVLPKNIAHRGARSLAPENTIAAAQKAVQAGADMWELDVTITADGELIVLHDDTLNRTTNVAEVFPDRAPWKAHTFLLDEIRELDAGSWFVAQDPFGQIAAEAVSEADQQAYAGEKIPTLEEALLFTREHNWQVNVEIKDLDHTPGSAVIVERVVYLVRKLNMAEQVLISSFNHRYLVRSKQAAPQIRTAALVVMPTLFAARHLRHIEAQAYHPRLGAISPYRIQALRKRGFEVNVWTVNEERDLRRLMEYGVNGLITDYPQRLRELLGDAAG